MGIYTSIDQLIGKTPLLELKNIEKEFGLKARLLAKLECFNPAGSAKDRVAKAMLDDAENRGILNKDSVIIEPTSGNTGIGLASVAAARGYRAIIVMPDSMSMERRLLMTAYGAELVLTDGAKGMSGAIEKAEQLASEISGAFLAGQFVNPANPKAHYETTGPEIWVDTEGNVDIFVAGVGTGGMVTGVGQYLKEQVRLYFPAVMPASMACRALARVLSRRFWTRVSMTLSSPSPRSRPMMRDGSWAARRVFWWVFPPAQRCTPPSRSQSNRKMKVRTSWCCCRTPASGTCPPPCSRGNNRIQKYL